MKTTSGKILASAALVGAAAVAGMGTYGASTSASQEVMAGTVVIALRRNQPRDMLNVPVVGILPGTSAGKTSSLLTAELTDGLQVALANCSIPWTGKAVPYTCTKTQNAVLAAGLSIPPTRY